jgi:hypothetical protein
MSADRQRNTGGPGHRGGQSAVGSRSSPVKTCSIPTLRGRSTQNGRTSTSKGRGGPTPCSPRRVRNERESGRRGAAPLPCCLLLPSALPRLPTPHAASPRPAGTPSHWHSSVSPGSRVRAASDPSTASPLRHRLGAASGERLNSLVLPWQLYARTHANVHLGCLCSL